MNFLFEITSEYIPSYTGKSIFRAKVYYEVREGEVVNANVMLPLNVLLYIDDTKPLFKEINDAISKDAEALLEEDKEFEKPEPEYNDQERQEERYLQDFWLGSNGGRLFRQESPPF